MTTPDDFLARINAEAARLTQRDAELAEQEESIKRQRADIRTRAADLHRALDVLREFVDLPEAQSGAGLFDEAASAVTPPAGTIADVSEQIMAARGGRMRVADLRDELARVGKIKGTKNDYGSIHGTLKRDARFIQSGAGEYRLATVPPSANGSRPPSGQSQPVAPG